MAAGQEPASLVADEWANNAQNTPLGCWTLLVRHYSVSPSRKPKQQQQHDLAFKLTLLLLISQFLRLSEVAEGAGKGEESFT